MLLLLFGAEIQKRFLLYIDTNSDIVQAAFSWMEQSYICFKNSVYAKPYCIFIFSSSENSLWVMNVNWSVFYVGFFPQYLPPDWISRSHIYFFFQRSSAYSVVPSSFTCANRSAGPYATCVMALQNLRPFNKFTLFRRAREIHTTTEEALFSPVNLIFQSRVDCSAKGGISYCKLCFISVNHFKTRNVGLLLFVRAYLAVFLRRKGRNLKLDFQTLTKNLRRNPLSTTNKLVTAFSEGEKL